MTLTDACLLQGTWYMGLPHGLGIAEFASGAAYCGEWYLGDRHGYGMYFFTDHPDEPHKEYVGQWRNDTFYGVGKRMSKDGSMYLGNWKKGLRHGDGIARCLSCLSRLTSVSDTCFFLAHMYCQVSLTPVASETCFCIRDLL